MISWSISAAKEAECFDKIIVSTDDSEIAAFCRQKGVEVPFLRPKDLSNDFASTKEVIVHAIDWYERKGSYLESVCCLYPTAPFILSTDLKQAILKLEDSKPSTYVFAATSFPSPIQRGFRLNNEGYASMLDPNCFSKRSQDLEEIFHDVGQFYIAKSKTWKEVTNIFEDSRPLVLPRWRVQDIDTEEDWKRAELLHKLLNY